MAKVVGAVSDTLGEAHGLLSAAVAVATEVTAANGWVVIKESDGVGFAGAAGLGRVLGLINGWGAVGRDTVSANGNGAGVKN
jgi:hypothetical protein